MSIRNINTRNIRNINIRNINFKILVNENEIIFVRTDYIWARAMGFTGAQLADTDGVDIGQWKY